MIKEYLDYLKDNPNHYWFKRKIYGWGWVPVTWKGWLVIAIFIFFLIWNSLILMLNEPPTTGEIVWFFTKTITSVAMVIFICYKTGETPKWQWGITSNKEES